MKSNELEVEDKREIYLRLSVKKNTEFIGECLGIETCVELHEEKSFKESFLINESRII